MTEKRLGGHDGLRLNRVHIMCGAISKPWPRPLKPPSDRRSYRLTATSTTVSIVEITRFGIEGL